jgi:lipoyl(octanoyl) transferase
MPGRPEAARRPGEAWRLVGLRGGEPLAFPGAENMAVDGALLEAVAARPAADGGGVLRLYRWARPTLSLGRNQAARGVYDAAAAASLGIDIVRRPTGGMAVLHDRELTYAVAVPVGALGSPRETYVAINRALVAGLRRLGVVAAVAPGPDAARGEDGGGAGGGGAAAGGAARLEGACFRVAAPGEVQVAGRKLVGSAQRRDGSALLQHGSILVAGDQRAAWSLAGLPAPADEAPAVLAELLGAPPPWPVLAAAVVAGFEESLGIRFASHGLSPAEAARARELSGTYASEAWTWRR